MSLCFVRILVYVFYVFMTNIRNFVIIAHVDHGKSTLADRFLELTGTIEKRKMREQFLDQMELEREKGITIKMQPVRMSYKLQATSYVLNLIDTPGHVDFSYEVSRALAAVEGAILLVDATQGIQAQTLANLHLAQKEGLMIIPVINKIDLPSAEVEKTEEELRQILNQPLSYADETEACTKELLYKSVPTVSSKRPSMTMRISAKTGEGVENLLRAVVERIPPPLIAERNRGDDLRALVFDSLYDPYLGVVAYVRIFEGVLHQAEKIKFMASGAEAEAVELGFFLPERIPTDKLSAGEIGYVATGIKEPELVRVGDTITRNIDLSKFRNIEMLPGYKEPPPMVFASLYPENADEYDKLRDALKKIKLNDASIFFEPESSDALGRGFRVGFLGMLHMEIIGERLKREYGINAIFSAPSVALHVILKGQGANSAPDAKNQLIVYSASRLPDENLISEIQEPWVKVEIITPQKFLGNVLKLLQDTRGNYLSQRFLGTERLAIIYEAPLKDILTYFFDKLKSVTEGYGSMGYEWLEYRTGDLSRLDILIAGEKEETFSEIVPREKVYAEGRRIVGKLKELLPKQLFAVSIQAASGGRIVARETLPALKKDVTGYLYGGDRTRKMKLWKKQQRGKKKLKERGVVKIPHEVFLKMIER